MYKELGEWRSALVVYRFVLAQLGVVEADPALPMQHIFSGEERRDKHVVTALVYRATVLHAMGRYVSLRVCSVQCAGCGICVRRGTCLSSLQTL